MSGEQLVELIEKLAPESRAVVERLIEVLAAKESAFVEVPRAHFLDVRCLSGAGRTADEIVLNIRDERSSWQDR
jgi:hypothetical protein